MNSTWLTRCDNSGTSSRGRPHYLKSKKKAEEEEVKASGTADYHNNRTLGYESSESSWQQSQEQQKQKTNFFKLHVYQRDKKSRSAQQTLIKDTSSPQQTLQWRQTTAENYQKETIVSMPASP